MKIILVPTDFSPNSINAIKYAAHLAERIGAKIILFHVYDIPVSDRKVASPIITLEEVENKLLKTCELIREQIHQEISQNIEIECVIRLGEAVEEINKMALKVGSNAIVMGIVGISKIDEFLIGSVASAVMRFAPCPVLLVPGEAKFKDVKKIVFAIDTYELQGSQGLIFLKEIAKTFEAKVLVLNIMKDHDSEIENKSARINLPAIFVNDMNYSINFLEEENPVNGIHDFAMENKADLIAMIPHKYSLLEHLFRKSNTKEIAFHTKIPLLTLPENEE